MEKKNLCLHGIDSRNCFLMACLYNKFADGYNEAMKIVEESQTSDEVISKILSDDRMKMTQIYAELSKDQPWHDVRIQNSIKEWHETISDAGGLKIGCKDFSVIIDNGYGDGSMYFAVVDKGSFNNNMLKFWTSVEGHAIDIYDYDCNGGDVIMTLDGEYGVYFGYGFVVFERWGFAN